MGLCKSEDWMPVDSGSWWKADGELRIENS